MVQLSNWHAHTHARTHERTHTRTHAHRGTMLYCGLRPEQFPKSLTEDDVEMNQQLVYFVHTELLFYDQCQCVTLTSFLERIGTWLSCLWMRASFLDYSQIDSV